MQQPKSNPVFLDALKKRNLSAFNQFYSEYGPAFYGEIRKSLPQQIADEALAEAFIHIWNTLEQYDSSKERLFTWSLKVVRNEACRRKVNLVLKELFACRTIPNKTPELQRG